MRQFCCDVLDAWSAYDTSGHPLTLGHAFLRDMLPELLGSFNARRSAENRLPYLAALMCCAPFDIALHDAYGHAAGRSIYDCYSSRDMPDDLTAYIDNGDADFRGLYPTTFSRTAQTGSLRGMPSGELTRCPEARGPLKSREVGFPRPWKSGYAKTG